MLVPFFFLAAVSPSRQFAFRRMVAVHLALLAGLALAISLLPEEFPVILTVFLALGAWRIARSYPLAGDAARIC